MPEIRKDYLRKKYVIISKERGKRPKDFKEAVNQPSDNSKCPFCPQNEHMIPGVIEEIKSGDKWITRAILNKFKAAYPEGNPDFETHNEFYTFSDAVGDHEVIIDTPDHDVELSELNPQHIEQVLGLLIERVKDGYSKGSKYVCVLKNKGTDAGASLAHSHHQIIRLNLFPPEIKEEIELIKNYKTDCPYCDIIKSEKDSSRKIFEDDKFVAFTPYASKFSFEAWILPKRCISTLTMLDEDEKKSLANILKKLLKKLDVKGFSYNLLYKLAKEGDKYHFRIEIAPRLGKWAGYELNTGIIINSIVPEDAAEYYRLD